MPTNANTFNSRVTSEALEAKFRQVFPSQGGAELGQDLFASGVIQPVIDFSSVAEGSILPTNLQTAWDFSTGSITNNSAGAKTIINNTGFWLVDVVAHIEVQAAAQFSAIFMTDGSSNKGIWGINSPSGAVANNYSVAEGKFVVFLRAGDSLLTTVSGAAATTDIWWRQIADVNGNLVNPLGFTFS